ncbi:MAG: hypothetical protein BJ554DRAFT_2536, partial [Olpidium bornovanus]
GWRAPRVREPWLGARTIGDSFEGLLRASVPDSGQVSDEGLSGAQPTMAALDVQVLVAQMRSSEVRAAVVQYTKENGLFQEENVTQYLRKFEVAVRQWELTDSELLRYFRLTAHEDCEERVAAAVWLCFLLLCMVK